MNYEQRIRACPYCFSPNITERTLIGGPMAHLDNDDGTFKCLQCGKFGVPLDFSSAQEYREFVLKGDSAEDPDHWPQIIPIIPAMKEKTGFAASRVVVHDIYWDGGLQTGEQTADFKDYWRAVSGPAYGTKEAVLLDLDGISMGKPMVIELRDLLRRRGQMWLDIGVRNVQDIFDSFTLGAGRVIALSLAVPNIDIFEDILEISDNCVPCLCIGEGVVWERKQGKAEDIRKPLDQLGDMGFEKVAIMDLKALGTDRPYREELLQRMSGIDIEILAGGGINLANIMQFEDPRVVGAMLDPFGPEIVRNLTQGKDE